MEKKKESDASPCSSRAKAEMVVKSSNTSVDHPRPSIPQHQFKIKAYALLRFPDKDVPLSTKEAFLGRNP